MLRRLRLPLLRPIRALLRWRARPLALPPGPLLLVAPHPDDESIGCGCLVHRERLAGRTVDLVFLTDGSASHSGHPTLAPAAVAALRRAEAAEAARRLGVDPARVHFLLLSDGQLPHLSAEARAEAVDGLRALLDRLQPAVLLCTSALDGSSEHVAAAGLVAAARARARTRPLTLGYLVWALYSPRLLLRIALSPTRILRLHAPASGPAKTHALAAHVSQFTPTAPWTEPVQPAGFLPAVSPAEEFFLDQNHDHVIQRAELPDPSAPAHPIRPLRPTRRTGAARAGNGT